MSSTRNKNIKYGKKNIIAGDAFDANQGKIRISLMIDIQVYEAFKSKAQENGAKYQVLMREALRQSVFSKEQDLEARLARLEAIVMK